VILDIVKNLAPEIMSPLVWRDERLTRQSSRASSSKAGEFSSRTASVSRTWTLRTAPPRAVARYLQDAAIEDVEETGWGLPDHLWFIRHIRMDVIAPFLDDRDVGLVTWSSGRAAVAAGRRWTVTGDRGGRIEVDSVWIHLGPDERPARLDDFGVYAPSAGDRLVTTKLELPDPPADAPRLQWPLRVTDIDLHGHLNNAAYWHAIEERLARRGPDSTGPLRAMFDYRQPIASRRRQRYGMARGMTAFTWRSPRRAACGPSPGS
jgi:acyl-ACP thioesterase